MLEYKIKKTPIRILPFRSKSNIKRITTIALLPQKKGFSFPEIGYLLLWVKAITTCTRINKLYTKTKTQKKVATHVM